MTGLVMAIRVWFRSLVCGLRGHNEVLHVEDHFIQMRCPSCGSHSPGWEIGAR